MRNKLKVLAILSMWGASFYFAGSAVHNVSATETYTGDATCPNGTYVIGYDKGDEGVPICKQNPTGCPYADSIPADSPKCGPPENQSTTGKDATPPDPNRPYYDAAGNEYDYQGNLIKAAAPLEEATPVTNCQGK